MTRRGRSDLFELLKLPFSQWLCSVDEAAGEMEPKCPEPVRREKKDKFLLFERESTVLHRSPSAV